MSGAIEDRTQPHRYRKLDARVEAHPIVLASSPAPEGHGHWNLRLMADRMVELGVVKSLSHEDGASAPEKNALPSHPNRGGRPVRTMNMGAAGVAICSCAMNPWPGSGE